MDYISSWRSPSNIALVKYWGKHGVQLPRNPSLSFTLSACHTDMFFKVTIESEKPGVDVLYGGNEAPPFTPTIKSFFTLLHDQLPWLKNASVVIDSVNTFPHAAGIASSASSMSALALCLVDIDDQFKSVESPRSDEWWKRVSEFARLASGSACRSLFPVAALWGEMKGMEESSDRYAIPFVDKLAPVYHTYQDAILVVSSEEKKVSSSAGHDLMNDLAYAQVRYMQAEANLDNLLTHMQHEESLQVFNAICESEALQLHALMMMGPAPYLLLEADTLLIIKEVWRFREETNIPLCFTLDAGPNVHLLYPLAFKAEVLDFIQSDLLKHCQDGIFILDEV